VTLSGGDLSETERMSYAVESTAPILMLVFQYVTNGGMNAHTVVSLLYCLKDKDGIAGASTGSSVLVLVWMCLILMESHR